MGNAVAANNAGTTLYFSCPAIENFGYQCTYAAQNTETTYTCNSLQGVSSWDTVCYQGTSPIYTCNSATNGYICLLPNLVVDATDPVITSVSAVNNGVVTVTGKNLSVLKQAWNIDGFPVTFTGTDDTLTIQVPAGVQGPIIFQWPYNYQGQTVQRTVTAKFGSDVPDNGSSSSKNGLWILLGLLAIVFIIIIVIILLARSKRYT